jgi:hypothetical protein
VKSCAPTCTVSCVHRVALVDALRERPLDTIDALVAAERARGGRPPLTVGWLRWLLVTGPQRHVVRRVAARVLRGSSAGAGPTV